MKLVWDSQKPSFIQNVTLHLVSLRYIMLLQPFGFTVMLMKLCNSKPAFWMKNGIFQYVLKDTSCVYGNMMSQKMKN